MDFEDFLATVETIATDISDANGGSLYKTLGFVLHNRDKFVQLQGYDRITKKIGR